MKHVCSLFSVHVKQFFEFCVLIHRVFSEIFCSPRAHTLDTSFLCLCNVWKGQLQNCFYTKPFSPEHGGPFFLILDLVLLNFSDFEPLSSIIIYQVSSSFILVSFWFMWQSQYSTVVCMINARILMPSSGKTESHACVVWKCDLCTYEAQSCFSCQSDVYIDKLIKEKDFKSTNSSTKHAVKIIREDFALKKLQ